MVINLLIQKNIDNQMYIAYKIKPAATKLPNLNAQIRILKA